MRSRQPILLPSWECRSFSRRSLFLQASSRRSERRVSTLLSRYGKSDVIRRRSSGTKWQARFLRRRWAETVRNGGAMEDRTHGREPHFDDPEFGAATGDLRENDPSLPGFTPDDEVVFRSYFQHANRFADRSYEDVRPAYQLGYAAGRNAQYEG